MKLRNPLGFSYITDTLKKQLFKTRGLPFHDGLFGLEKFPWFEALDIFSDFPQGNYKDDDNDDDDDVNDNDDDDVK